MNKNFNTSHVLLLTAILLLTAACSSDSSNDVQPSPTPNTSQEISLNPTIWQMMEGTRATLYDNTSLQSGFTVNAYTAGTETAYIDNKTVSYSTPNWIIADGPYYWPASSLDFYAYAPSSIPSYITTGPTYSYSEGQHVAFTCSSLSVTSEGQSGITEFVYAMAANQNKEEHGATGVTLNFAHPFSLVKLQLAANHPDIRIRSITFQTVKNSGTYNNGWTATSGTENMVWTINTDFDNNTSAKPIGDPMIVVPQEWAGVIVVNADCLLWGEKVNYPSLTTTIPTTWQPGYCYTYTFNIKPEDLTVDINKFTEQW